MPKDVTPDTHARLPIAYGATTPVPLGGVGSQCWSTTEKTSLIWDGTAWVWTNEKLIQAKVKTVTAVSVPAGASSVDATLAIQEGLTFAGVQDSSVSEIFATDYNDYAFINTPGINLAQAVDVVVNSTQLSLRGVSGLPVFGILTFSGGVYTVSFKELLSTGAQIPYVMQTSRSLYFGFTYNFRIHDLPSDLSSDDYLHRGIGYLPLYGDYTPDWTSDGAIQPSLGNGNIQGKWWLNGNLLTVTAQISTGTTTTFGNGFFLISAPVYAYGLIPFVYNPQAMVGSALLITDIGNSSSYRPAVTSSDQAKISIHGSTGKVGGTSFAWGSDSALTVTALFDIINAWE
jgi:hypothetical protein